jgi:iron complex transport system substrate-binding protein
MVHKKLLSLLLALLIFSMLFSACGQKVVSSPTPQPTQAPVSLTDAYGNVFTYQAPVQKIISLAPALTEILYAIGAGGQLIGRDSVSDYPEEVKQVTDIGGGFGELNSEKILSLVPDLVLTSDGITSPEQVKALQDTGLKVFVLPNPTDIPSLFDLLNLVAGITGHESEAKTLIENLQDRVAAVEEKLTNVAERPLVFYEIDSTDQNAPWTSGPGTFIDQLIQKAGGQNVGSSLQGDWAQISLEELIKQNPGIIILGDSLYGITPESVAARAGWDALSAVKDGKVFPFDDNLISRPGPRLVDGLEELAKLLHPELFE